MHLTKTHLRAGLLLMACLITALALALAEGHAPARADQPTPPAGASGSTGDTGSSGETGNSGTSGTTSSEDAVNDDPGALSNEQIGDIATQFAAKAHDPSPDTVQAVATDRQNAVAVTDPGAEVTDNPAVDVVVMHGDFTATMAKTIPGAQAPTGDELQVTIDAQTGEVTDWALTDSAPPIDQLGDPQDLNDDDSSSGTEETSTSQNP